MLEALGGFSRSSEQDLRSSFSVVGSSGGTMGSRSGMEEEEEEEECSTFVSIGVGREPALRRIAKLMVVCMYADMFCKAEGNSS